MRKNFAPALARLGAPAAGDTPDKNLLRATLFGLLGDIGDDPQIIAQARQISEQYLREPGSVEGTLAATALNVAAQNGDAAFFDQLQRVSQTAGDPQLRIQALSGPGEFSRSGAGRPHSRICGVRPGQKPGCLALNPDRDERPSYPGRGLAVRPAKLAQGADPDHHFDGGLPGRVDGQLLQRGPEPRDHGLF